MSTAAGLRPRRTVAREAGARRLALLGTGTVGSAFVARYQVLRQRGLPLPPVAWVANSRTVLAVADDPRASLEAARAAPRGVAAPAWPEVEALCAGDVVVDATASDAVAARHAAWLARGVHVVTANKLGHGAALARSQAIARAQAASGARYGDSATVGAGLPVLGSVRALVAGGDHVHVIEGVLSGSLAWLFHQFDGTRPFSALVRRAMAAGCTEPDPRVDLSGEDVRRKLLILARAAGFALEAAQVRVEPLLPAALAAAPAHGLEAALEALDKPLARRLDEARARGRRGGGAARAGAGRSAVRRCRHRQPRGHPQRPVPRAAAADPGAGRRRRGHRRGAAGRCAARVRRLSAAQARGRVPAAPNISSRPLSTSQPGSPSKPIMPGGGCAPGAGR